MPKRAVIPPLTRADLDRSGCGDPNCKHEHDDVLFLNGRCHPQADAEVSYYKKTGLLKVACATCKMTIARIVVGHANDLIRPWG